jgi:hypothetical protein
MNFSRGHDYLLDGREWRGIVSKRHIYSRWLDGKVELFNIESDPLQMQNEANNPKMSDERKALEEQFEKFMTERGDALNPGSSYNSWFDSYRRICRNALGLLGDPEGEPDWSLLS